MTCQSMAPEPDVVTPSIAVTGTAALQQQPEAIKTHIIPWPFSS
jgi:hypothetical protein